MSDFTYISWDIETAANERARDYYQRQHYKAPANWKDKAKIEEYVTTARHNDMEKAALTWWTGRVVCISLRWLDSRRSITIVGPDERLLLTQFFTVLARERRPQLIGKTADVFDRPFVLGRALALDTGIPDALRPYRQIEDLDHIFGMTSRSNQRGSLNDYAFGLGIPAKTGHGSAVQGWVNQAELGDETMWGKIGDYCASDADIVDEMLRRWMKTFLIPGTVPAGNTPEPIPEDEIPFGPSPTKAMVAVRGPTPLDYGDFD